MLEQKRIPIIEQVVNLQETKGLYKFFCKSTAALFTLAISILSIALDVLTMGQFEKLVSCIWIVNHNARKLEGICSVSSSVHDNARCALWRKIKNCICAKCYAFNQQCRQTGLKEHNIVNGIILRNVLIPVKAFKKLVIIFPYLRIESFGDVQNITQARNYIRIIKAFPRKRCAIWTKNIDIWHKAFEMEGKPNNTTFVLSSPFINKAYPETMLTKYPEIDHIFTVYTKAYATKHNIVINCGGRKCMNCIRKKENCYFRNTELFINELKK